jgi:EF-P beta-lysylation protein EpmB
VGVVISKLLGTPTVFFVSSSIVSISVVPPRTPLAAWQIALREAVRDVDELCGLLNLDPAWAKQARAAIQDFPLFVPRSYIARMRPGDPTDPLLKQVLPLAQETNESHNVPNLGSDPVGASEATEPCGSPWVAGVERSEPPALSPHAGGSLRSTPATPEFVHFPPVIDGGLMDPVGDLAAQRLPGLLQKYTGRVLLVTTGACAIHCRYCFRRHYPYDTAPKTLAAWQPAIDEIAADESISEVILSGGDPLTLRDSLLGALAERLAEIPHLRRLRVHTRLPLMIPERVNDELLAWLRGTRLSPVLVIHANHANELQGDAADAVQRIVAAGIPTLNQTVLLRGINDDVPKLAALSERLLDLGAMPYYLHQLDRVAGALHFEVPLEQGLEIVAALRARLPGYAVPRYVQERPGAESKTILV